MMVWCQSGGMLYILIENKECEKLHQETFCQKYGNKLFKGHIEKILVAAPDRESSNLCGVATISNLLIFWNFSPGVQQSKNVQNRNVAADLILNYKTDKAESPSSPLPKNNKNHNWSVFCVPDPAITSYSMPHYIGSWELGHLPASTRGHYDASPPPTSSSGPINALQWTLMDGTEGQTCKTASARNIIDSSCARTFLKI